MTVDLTGHRALVTGATSGLGRRFAALLAGRGAAVIGTGRRAERLDELASELERDGHVFHPMPMDVTQIDRLSHGIDAAEHLAGGPIDILVNNAGIPDAQYATKMPLDDINAVIDTNFRAPYVLSVEVAKRLIAAKHPGRIVNIASLGAFSYAGGGAALYSITKAAVVRMTEALAVEWSGFHINVNAIAPGLFASEMSDGMLERMGDLTRHFPRRRIGQPEQLDTTLLYLVDPASECVTGTVIKVDDGQGSR